MAIFNSYVKLPEGTFYFSFIQPIHRNGMMIPNVQPISQVSTNQITIEASCKQFIVSGGFT